MVASGSVLTVSGPISSSTYMVSGYAGFFVDVLAHSGRCTTAPLRGQRLPPVAAERLLEHLVGQLALGDGTLAAQLERLGGADGLESVIDLGVDPADEEAGDAGHLRQVGARLLGVQLQTARCTRRSPPAYRSRLKINVTLMLRPSAIIAWMGPMPSAVAGILTIRFGRWICSCRSTCRGLGAGAVVGEPGIDLDADEAVGTVAVVVQLGEDVERAVDVGEHHRPVVVDDRVFGCGELPNCSS